MPRIARFSAAHPDIDVRLNASLVAPFGLEGLNVQGYTLNLLKSRAELPKLRSFQDWLFAELEK
jgi:hypothetical protein